MTERDITQQEPWRRGAQVGFARQALEEFAESLALQPGEHIERSLPADAILLIGRPGSQVAWQRSDFIAGQSTGDWRLMTDDDPKSATLEDILGYTYQPDDPAQILHEPVLTLSQIQAALKDYGARLSTREKTKLRDLPSGS